MGFVKVILYYITVLVTNRYNNSDSIYFFDTFNNYFINLFQEISTEFDSQANMDKVTFATSVPMSTYLACFVICDFDHKVAEINSSNIGNNFILRSFAQKQELHKINFALSIGKRATEFYIKYYEVPFPLPKLGNTKNMHFLHLSLFNTFGSRIMLKLAIVVNNNRF